MRGTTIGTLLGVLPGGGALLASFAAYTFEKKISRRTRSGSARAKSKASQRPSPPTMPARKPPSFRC